MAHGVSSETSALDDVQEALEDRLAPELEKIRTVPGHALDAPARPSNADPIRAIEHFLAQIDGTGRDTGRGVGLGEEVLLRGEVAGIGLVYERTLVHLAAFPAPEEMAEAG